MIKPTVFYAFQKRGNVYFADFYLNIKYIESKYYSRINSIYTDAVYIIVYIMMQNIIL